MLSRSKDVKPDDARLWAGLGYCCEAKGTWIICGVCDGRDGDRLAIRVLHNHSIELLQVVEHA